MQRILSLVRRCVEDYHMIDEGDTVAVGVSGGKDSVLTLAALAKLRDFYPKQFELAALTIDSGTPDTDFSPIVRLCEELEGFEGRRFEKSAFGSVECGSYAALGGYDRVELAGLCTDICVISNAMVIKAMAPELPVMVDAECCAGVTPKSHRNALEAMKMCQVEVPGI